MRTQSIEVHKSPQVPPAPPASRDLISIHDLAPHEVHALFNLTAMLKQRPADFRGVLAGKQMVMFFEKPSLRTRLTFEAGMDSLGGSTFFVDQTRSRLDARESLYDIAHNLERWIDVIVLRTYRHATVEEMAAHADVPVINALSEVEHPCQALADFFTLQEHFGNVSKIHLAYVGDGNNVAHSLLLTGAALGAAVSIATPEAYRPNPGIVAAAELLAEQSGAAINILTDPAEAVAGADAVYTDAWASMGQEDEADVRSGVFAPYQVNGELMQYAAPHAKVMHCLPAHRGWEVTDEVIDSPNSVVFDQAENRLHIQKAILVWLLGGGVGRLPVRSAHA
ncbi:MAG TPA: ornithine carbamoyltransferase [Terriglobales bacterium]|nr:ornithine carbamoyltransferase [Terriglobales bacterium]